MKCNRLEIFIELDKHLEKTYREHNLQCLEEFKIDNLDAISYYHKIISNKNKVKNFNDLELIFDMQFISADIKFLTGLLFILRPLINLPSKEKGTYFQNRYDARYLTFASLAHQSVYNFWDRLGDLLYFYFNISIKEKDVYISTVIKEFPGEYRENEYFKKLEKLYKENIKLLISERAQIVHYEYIKTKHVLGTLQNNDNQDKLIELEKEKINYPEYFKKHLFYCNIGFEYTLKLINGAI